MKLCVVSMVINQRSCRKEGMLGLNFRFVVGGTHLDSHFFWFYNEVLYIKTDIFYCTFGQTF